MNKTACVLTRAVFLLRTVVEIYTSPESEKLGKVMSRSNQERAQELHRWRGRDRAVESRFARFARMEKIQELLVKVLW